MRVSGFYERGEWYEALNIRGGAVPTCGVGQRINFDDGIDEIYVISGLCRAGWRDDLERRGFVQAHHQDAMDSRWTQNIYRRNRALTTRAGDSGSAADSQRAEGQ